jgi:PAS domain S-box-containing protein
MLGNDEIATLDREFHAMAQDLQESRNKERAVIDNANDFIFSLDRRGVFVSANPAAETMLGYHPDELLGVRFTKLVPAADTQDILNILKLLTEGGNEPPFETNLRRKDGRNIEVICSASWSNQEKAIFCVAHDITARKQAERFRTELIQMVSHDLRTPLTSIRGTIELLLMSNAVQTKENQNLLQIADRSAERMVTLINDLLDIEKMEAGMLQLDRHEVELSEVLTNAAQSMTYKSEQKKVAINVVETSLRVNADSDRLIQILVNLIANAIKFSSAGTTITLNAIAVNGSAVIGVQDQGRGIPAELIPTIFDRFQQVRASDSKKDHGSGLGLAICKALVELHGGTISVESQVGKGSIFKITLPMAGTVEAVKDKSYLQKPA